MAIYFKVTAYFYTAVTFINGTEVFILENDKFLWNSLIKVVQCTGYIVHWTCTLPKFNIPSSEAREHNAK